MGGFEVFDDVAFFYLAQSLICVFLFPFTLYVIVDFVNDLREKKKEIELIDPSKYGKDIRRVETKETFVEKYMKKRYLFMIIGWVVFILMMTQVSQYSNQELASFKPFEILGIDVDAPDDQIKRAYRKLAIKFHPDKNPSDEAQAQFIQITKAYQTLTDPVAQENMRLYGNPDGKQAQSVTIGLPSFLMAKENSLKVLLCYFLFMLIVPPVFVFMWWAKKKQYSQTGVMHFSLQYYVKYITEHMSSKYLIEILALSHEFKVLEERNNTVAAETERKKLVAAIKDNMVKQKFKLVYVQRASLLIHAYLLRIPIPEMFDEDMKLILMNAHKLLSSMGGICLWRRFQKAATGCTELSQLLSQAMWFAQDPLLQLPHINERVLRNINAKKMKMTTLDGLRQNPMDSWEKAFGLTKTECDDIKHVLDIMPNLKLEEKHEVKDEEGIYVGDIVHIRCTLTRLAPDEVDQNSEAMTGDEGSRVAEGDDDRDEDVKDKDTEVVKKKKDKDDDEDEGDEGDDSEDEDWEADERERNLLAELPVENRRKKKGGQGPLSHCPMFPFPKHEEWTLMLMKYTKKNKSLRLCGLEKVEPLHDSCEVDFYVRAEEVGIDQYELHAKCDSYVGCDRKLTFKMKIEKMSSDQKTEMETTLAKGKKQGLDDDDEEELLVEEEGKWYYLYFPSFFEMVANLIVLFVLGMFIVNFLQTRGYWDKYFTPYINKLMVFVNPVIENVYVPFIKPVVEPAWKTFTDWVIVDPTKMPKAKRGGL